MDSKDMERKLFFYERVYIPFLRETFEDFIDEISKNPIYIEDYETNARSMELLGNIAVLLREPRIIDSTNKECH